ncbi:hypothetical protein K3712_000527 [Escherichia coli]|nr:hypothetical protein [Escherichia coli]
MSNVVEVVEGEEVSVSTAAIREVFDAAKAANADHVSEAKAAALTALAKFKADCKRAKEKAERAGETSYTIDFVPVEVHELISSHIENRNPKDHVKGDYLKGKIDPVKRDTCRAVTLLELSKEDNAALWIRTEETDPNFVRSAPFIKGDAHCRAYAWFTAPGDENGFRFERPTTLKVTVIFGLNDDQTFEYLKHRGAKDCQLSAKDSRIMQLKNAQFDLAKASPFLLSPWKTAYRACGVGKAGDEALGVTRFATALGAIDKLGIKKTKGGRASTCVKAAMLLTFEEALAHEEQSKQNAALYVWDLFWSAFMDEDCDINAINKAIAKIDNKGNHGAELKKIRVLFTKVKIEELEAEKVKREANATAE